MPPWAIKKKQKADFQGPQGPRGPPGPQGIGALPFIYKNLSNFMLEDYFINFTVLLYKFERNNIGVTVNDTNQIITMVNQTPRYVTAVPSLNSPYLSDVKNNENINNRFFLVFKGVNYLSLNIRPTIPNFFNVFIVFKLKRRPINTNTNAYVNTLFSYRNDSTSSGNKKIRFFANGSLVIGGTNARPGFVVIGPHNVNANIPIAGYKNKADPSEFEKWCSLSVHWNNFDSHPASVWCNGQKLANFISSRNPAVPNIPDPFIIRGHILSGGRVIEELVGSIALFSYNAKLMLENDIKLHYSVFCLNWYNIQHKPIFII